LKAPCFCSPIAEKAVFASLYYLDYYYIELVFDTISETIVEVTPFISGERLNKYLGRMAIVKDDVSIRLQISL